MQFEFMGWSAIKVFFSKPQHTGLGPLDHSVNLQIAAFHIYMLYVDLGITINDRHQESRHNQKLMIMILEFEFIKSRNIFAWSPGVSISGASEELAAVSCGTRPFM